MSNIGKYFHKISKKRDLSGEYNPEDGRKKPEKEVLQPAIMMLLRMKKYFTKSAQQMIFQKC